MTFTNVQSGLARSRRSNSLHAAEERNVLDTKGMKPNADAENYSCNKQLVNLETLLEVNQLPDVNIARPAVVARKRRTQ